MTTEDGLEKAIQFIRKYEWVRLKAYWDYNQWSIWYWTKSYKGEIITQEEADKRLYEAVKARFDRVDFEHLTANQKASLTSFGYNCWFRGNIINYAKKWDHDSVIYLMNTYCKTAGWKVLKWLVKRRWEEVQLYKL